MWRGRERDRQRQRVRNTPELNRGDPQQRFEDVVSILNIFLKSVNFKTANFNQLISVQFCVQRL